MNLTNDLNFQTDVLDSGKLVVVDFAATWCSPCKVLAPILDSVSEDLKDVQFFKVDIDDSPEVSEDYDIRAVPTLVLFKGGKEVARHKGLANKQVLTDLINSHKD